MAWTVFFNPTVFAGGLSNITTTTSTSSHTILGCPPPPVPPGCGLLDPGGTTLTCVTLTFGPACIRVGNLDVPNDQPCGTTPPFGTPFIVAAGTENINTNTDTITFLCKASTAPALAPWALALCAAVLVGYAVWRVSRTRRASS